MKFSVISPAYNAHLTIQKCIEGLQKQTYKDFEVIFVDSSPEDNSQKIVDEYSDYQLVRSSKRLSSQSARNIGAEKASGDILVFLDADCIPEENWLLQLNKSFSSGHLVVGGSIGCYPGNYMAGVAQIEKCWKWLPHGKPGFLEYFPTGNFAVQKKIFFEMGKFYEEYEAADLEFCYRLNKKNIGMYFNPGAIVNHIHNIRFKELIVQRYDRGKQLADMKIHRYKWNKLTSVIYLLTSLFIPWYNMIHWMFVCMQRKYFGTYIKSLPVLIIGEYAWYLSQDINYFRHIVGRIRN